MAGKASSLPRRRGQRLSLGIGIAIWSDSMNQHPADALANRSH
jgi:hypothetical protein